MNLFFDTETSGMANFAAPYTDPSQPHLVQLGCVLAEDSGTVAAQVEFIVRPDGWTISDSAIAMHGITNEIAAQCGLSLHMVLSCFNMLCRRADVIAAHNLAFGELIMKSAYLRQDMLWTHTMPDWVCTMTDAAPILKLPNRRGGYKWPSLAEAHAHFCNEPFDGAHSALADAKACMRIYQAMHRQPALALEMAGEPA